MTGPAERKPPGNAGAYEFMPPGPPAPPTLSKGSPVGAAAEAREAEHEPPESLEFHELDLRTGVPWWEMGQPISPIVTQQTTVAKAQASLEEKKAEDVHKADDTKEKKSVFSIIGHPIMLAGMFLLEAVGLIGMGINAIVNAAKNHINADMKDKSDQEIGAKLSELAAQGKNRYYREKLKKSENGEIETRVFLVRGKDPVVISLKFKLNPPPSEYKYHVEVEESTEHEGEVFGDKTKSARGYIEYLVKKEKATRLKEGDLTLPPSEYEITV